MINKELYRLSLICQNVYKFNEIVIISNLDIFSLISLSDNFSTGNDQSVWHQTSVTTNWPILKIFCQWDIKHQYQQTVSDTGNYQSVWHQTSVSTNCLWYWKLSVNVTSNISNNKLTDTGNYLSVWQQIHYDVTNNNVTFKGLDIHYHK